MIDVSEKIKKWQRRFFFAGGGGGGGGVGGESKQNEMCIKYSILRSCCHITHRYQL